MNIAVKSQFFRAEFWFASVFLLTFFLLATSAPSAEAGHLSAEEQTQCLAGGRVCSTLQLSDPKLVCPSEEKKGLVPCGREYDNPNTPILECADCNFCHFFYFFDNVINFIMWRLVPGAAILLIAAAGFFFAISKANYAHLSTAKTILIRTFLGWAIAFISWMLINSFLSIAGVKKWTGLTGEAGNISSVVSPGLTVTVNGNPSWQTNEWNGFPVVINYTIIPTGEIINDNRTITANTANTFTVNLGLPFGAEIQHNSYKISGWWNFSCGFAPVSPLPPPVVSPPDAAPPPAPAPETTEVLLPAPSPQPNPIIGQWTNYNRPGPWINKINHTAAVLKDNDGREKIWVMGGYSQTAEDTVYAFDGVTWKIKPKMPGARGDFSAITFKYPTDSTEKIWTIGGRDALNNPSPERWAFNPVAQGWESKGGVTSRYHHAAALLRGKIWIIGGYTLFLGNERDVWSCDTAGCSDNGRKLDLPPEEGVVDHVAITYDNGGGEKIWLLGGREGEDNEKEIWTFDGTIWTKQAAQVPAPGIIGGHAAAVFDKSADGTDPRIWIIGGKQGRIDENTFWSSGGSNVWSFNGSAWRAETTLPTNAGWADHAAVVFKDPRDDKNKIWVIGGFSGRGSGTYANDLWLYTPADSTLAPPAGPKKVFVTSQTYNADLTEPDPSDPDEISSGLEGADLKCQRLADAPGGVSGTFMAWLSDGSNSPDSRFTTKNNGPYELADGTKIADNWTGVVDGYLQNPINQDENGITISNRYVWTAATPFGKADPNDQFCTNWTTDSSLVYLNAHLGNTDFKDTRWTDTAVNIYCGTQRSLYCFEQ